MIAAAEPNHDALAASFRQARPAGPGPASLEQRLAIAAILAASSAAQESPRLGRLEVQSRIGGGGMGVVYRAYDPDLRRLVAVKLLRGWTRPEQRALIAEEARALARLNDPNVVAVYDIVNDRDDLYFVMEYVAGVTLHAWLQAHAEAAWREVVAWFLQAGRGLSAAHGAGIVHRDFKPDNVLVGEDGRVRVADFGLAQENAGGDGTVGGTPHYMAPEAREGRGVSAASDQFSFCKALHDALGGKAPPAHVMSAVERGLRDDPRERHAELGALLEILQGALAGAGEDRSRTLLLERVERLWLRGVLERSLGGAAAADLELRSAQHLVSPPWQSWGISTEPAQATSSSELSHILRESNGSLLIVGPPGSGKTTLLLLLCRDLLRTSSVDPAAPVPAVLSLSTYHPEDRPNRSQSEHFAAWIGDELVTKYGLARSMVRRWLDEAGIVLLLDGLDETDPRLRGRIVETLNRFREHYPMALVVTCRDSEYESLEIRLSFGAAVSVQPLDDAGIKSLVEERRATQLMAQLARDPSLREPLRNPLMLMLYASGETSADLEQAGQGTEWTRAYDRYVEHAFAQVEKSQERAELEAQLGFLARAMQRHNTSDLWLEQLHFGWLGRRWERNAGYAMGILIVLLFGVGLNLSQVPLTGDPIESALTFGLGVSITSFAYTRGRSRPVERLRWSWRRAMRLLPITTICALIVGLAEALRVNFASNMVGAGITGAILALVFALEPGDHATKLRPNAGIRRSLAYALGVSFGFGIPVGLLFAFIINPYITMPLRVQLEHAGNPSLVVGVAVGLFVFTALFLIYGGFTVIMHWVLRLWMAWRTPLPLDLEPVLNRAAELGLMRRVGGGYVFLHRTLLGYFADRVVRAKRAARKCGNRTARPAA